jgi:hypothetical protein
VAVKSIILLKIDVEEEKASITGSDVLELLKRINCDGEGGLDFVELAPFLLQAHGETFEEGYDVHSKVQAHIRSKTRLPRTWRVSCTSSA